ncbi:uncharacterized protein LOC123667261 [Melitaea cinxia]|uniref:uncharacterized protein LOC123667261 n=1 Tax=Melitaea cinxia TaxID=113334 RepID=UPI001E2705E3|nr:uncharacterized protein LOC123667261 [Melitaea cinxia]
MLPSDIKCVKDKTFRAVKFSWVGNFSEVTCNVVPWFAVEEAGSCFRGYRLYRVGYKIDNVFHTTYEACFNKDLLHTAYVKHDLQLKTNVTQPGRRPQFREGELFGKVKMSKAYSNQSNRIKEVFGDKKLEEYVNNKQFLSRGHLAPRADFPLYSVQRTSFHYVNSAPQWMRGNAGDWAALEEAVRRRALRSEAKLEVYTGGVGVLALPDVSSTYKELYLGVDENNNGIIPVPLYMFKTIYEPSTKSAVVFLSINSSHFNSTMTDKLTFCNDICDSKQYSWLRWRSSDGTHSFCCTYEEFIKKYNVMPKLNVERVFY